MRKLLQVCPVISRRLPGLGTSRPGNGVISFELACFSPFSEVGIARNLYKYISYSSYLGNKKYYATNVQLSAR